MSTQPTPAQAAAKKPANVVTLKGNGKGPRKRGGGGGKKNKRREKKVEKKQPRQPRGGRRDPRRFGQKVLILHVTFLFFPTTCLQTSLVRSPFIEIYRVVLVVRLADHVNMHMNITLARSADHVYWFLRVVLGMEARPFLHVPK